jgi:hypothetical protein
MTEEKKRALNYREVKAEYDGHWVLFDDRDFPPEDDTGYVVAYGDGSDEDRDALREINHSKYDGEVILIKGWVPKDDDVFDSGIIEMV